MRNNEYRSEAVEIWKLIQSGILSQVDETPTPEFCRAQDFIQRVATDILSADEEQSCARGSAMLRAVRLQGKMSAFESVFKDAIDLVDDFYDCIADSDEISKKISHDMAVVRLLRQKSGKYADESFQNYIDQCGDEDILKAVIRIREKY